jgi:hypothetical protein
MNMPTKSEREIRYYNRRLVNEIMDLRDQRVRLQRKVAELEDKQFWEPDALTPGELYLLAYYRSQVVRIKATEEELRKQMK